MLLEDKDIKIAKKISDYFGLIASFNKNPKLKIDLEKLFINCEQHNIEGLIFKIKNDLTNKVKNQEKGENEKNEEIHEEKEENKEGKEGNNEGKEEKKDDNWINKEGLEYEDNMSKEIFKKIVPTFCQDIIASISILEKKLKKFNKFKEVILDIYKNSVYNNFELFFKNLQIRKNVIYTFSKIIIED